jgi:hypothetical protein
VICLLTATALADELPVLWAPAGFPPTLVDIASRLPRNTAAREPDLITYAHEGSHFLCRGKPGYHAIYVGGGKRWEIPTPPLITEQVFAAIPEANRHNSRSRTLYSTYLQQGKTEYWATQPLMILDEWRAYTVGSQVRQELRQESRAETVRHCETFTLYAKTLYDLAGKIPGYDMAELRAFCRWNLEQCRKIDGFSSPVEFD